MKQIDIVAAVLVVVGALNWGMVAIARVDLVAAQVLGAARLAGVSAGRGTRRSALRDRRRSAPSTS